MVNIYDEAKAVARKEVLRLTGVEISIATDEQIAKAREKYADFKPQAQMVLHYEPLSYELVGGKYGNARTDYFQITGFGKGLDEAQIEMVRQHGWVGAGNTGKRLTIPSSVAGAKEPWQMFMVYANKAGMRFERDANGVLTSPDIGEAFEFEAGFVGFPKRIETSPGSGKYRDSVPSKGEEAWNVYMRLPLQKLKDYVIPEDRPQIVITSGDDDATAPAPTTTGNGTAGSNITAELLIAACEETGLYGTEVSALSTMAQQVSFTGRNIGTAPVFASGEVSAACNAGGLVDYLVAKGAAVVEAGVIARPE